MRQFRSKLAAWRADGPKPVTGIKGPSKKQRARSPKFCPETASEFTLIGVFPSEISSLSFPSVGRPSWTLTGGIALNDWRRPRQAPYATESSHPPRTRSLDSGFGAEATVIKPASLRNLVARTVAQMNRRRVTKDIAQDTSARSPSSPR